MNIEDQLNYLLFQDHETEVLEFKEAKNNYDSNKLGTYFSALANEANLLGKPHAWLVFGVRDKDKYIVGSNFRATSTAKLQSLKSEVANKTTNRITFIEIHVINRPEGRVLLFQIPAAPQGVPIAWQGHYYGRDGEELNALNLEELERIRQQTVEDDWSIGICEGATIDDLSREALDKARELFVKKNSKLEDVCQAWDETTFLNKAKLCVQGKVTRAAILLLGKPESEHFISPAIAKVTWILKDRDNLEKDYEHFSCPLLLSVDEIYHKIRRLKYRYLPEGSLFPEEVDSYDPYIIREALNNCIAHQDYTLGGRINVVESEESFLVFSNKGGFIPQSVEKVIEADAPETRYRNRFLSNAMVNLSMIDTIGSGIKHMFSIQKKKFFPLPEYSFANSEVKVVITGKVLDLNYARKLAQAPDLSLHDIMLLDKVQKGKALNADEIKRLRNNQLIEGRKPNFYISSHIAKKTGQQGDYMKMRGIDNDYCKKIILEYLKEFGKASRKDFEEVILDKFSETLDIDQKRTKVKNSLQALKREGLIVSVGKTWSMSKGDK